MWIPGSFLAGRAVGNTVIFPGERAKRNASSVMVSIANSNSGSRLAHSFFINPASAANGLCVAFATEGVLREPSVKYC